MKVYTWLLGHKARVGKDTFYNTVEKLVEENEKGNVFICRTAFADKLKKTVSDLYGFSSEQMYGEAKDKIDERYNRTPRDILIKFGQEQREVCPDIWANYVFDKYDLATKDFNVSGYYDQEEIDNFSLHYFITDFRFKNEYIVAERWLNTPIKDVEKRLITVDIIKSDVVSIDDISEKDLDGFDWNWTLENNGSLEEYQAKVKDLFLSYQRVD